MTNDMARKKSAVNDHIKANRDKYKRLRAELDAAIESERNPKRLKRLIAAQEKCIEHEDKFGLDPFSIAIIIAVIEAVLKWWFAHRKDGG
jgi:hypothetical protein